MQYSPLPAYKHQREAEHEELVERTEEPATWEAGGEGILVETRPSRWISKRLILVIVGASVLALTVLMSHSTPATPMTPGLTRGSSAPWRLYRSERMDSMRSKFDRSLVMAHPETPQDSLISQLKPEVRYITALSYGGHANQFFGIQNLLYLGKLLNRVVIIPTLTPLHFEGFPQDMSKFYDLDYFYDRTAIPAIELSRFKWWNFTAPPPIEPLSCWSVLEQVAGGRNINDGSMAVHNVDVKYFPLPELTRASEESKIWFGAIHEFDSNPWMKEEWVKTVREDLLPRADNGSDSEQAIDDAVPTLKPGFDPRNTEPPSDQLFCLDNTFFLGSRMLPPAYPATPPVDPLRSYEGRGWIEAGQYLRFSDHLENIADEYLKALFGVSKVSDIPPFITCHIRRGDFAEARGLTSLDKYTDAVERVRARLDARVNELHEGKGRGEVLRSAEVEIVVATDEDPGSDFVKGLKEDLGWRVIDHNFMQTEKELGAWYPLLIDSVILSRGISFVGTEWSTFSYLAGLRVKYWNGGIQEWTPSL